MKSISKINPIASIEYLCVTPENQYLERKGIDEAGLKPTKLANELIGMLNADGGIIVLGVSDSGEIQDLTELDSDLLNNYRRVCHDLIKPPAKIELEEITLESGELIFLYHVDQDYETMFCRSDNEAVYKRVADSNKGPLSLDEVDKLRYDKSLRKYEEMDRADFDPEDLDVPMITLYKEKIHYNGLLEDLLIKRNLAKRKDGVVTYKNSAILLFSKDPDKYIPTAYVRYVRYAGDKQESGKDFNVTKDVRIEGNIPTVIDGVREILFASLDDFYYLDMETGRFVSIPEYPEDAWLEGVVNALFHRSYNLQGNAIYIRHFDDRLEISNSGPLPAQVNIENIRAQRFSRNPRIGRVLSEMGYVRELNEGVNRIYRSMEDSMLSEPEYSDIDDIVTLKLVNKVAKHKKTIATQVMDLISQQWSIYNDTERKILSYLFARFDASVIELSEYCHVSERAIRGYLNKFSSLCIVDRDSPKQRDRNARYTFRKI